MVYVYIYICIYIYIYVRSASPCVAALFPKKRYILLFCSSEGRKRSKYGVHQGICVYICRFTKVTGNVLSICVFNVLSMQKSKDMFYISICCF